MSIKNELYDDDKDKIETIKRNTFDWLVLFESVYSASRITPYLHIFGDHLYEMVEIHGNINAFTMQGLEKLNDITTQHYFSATNKSENYLVQLLNKRNRLDLTNNLN